MIRSTDFQQRYRGNSMPFNKMALGQLAILKQKQKETETKTKTKVKL